MPICAQYSIQWFHVNHNQEEIAPRNEHRFDVCIFDGCVAEEDSMLLAVFPTEHDWLGRDDAPCAYRRHFNQPLETWIGNYRPADEGLR